MNIHQAMQIVLELANQNVIDDFDMQDERAKQEEAISIASEWLINHGVEIA